MMHKKLLLLLAISLLLVSCKQPTPKDNLTSPSVDNNLTSPSVEDGMMTVVGSKDLTFSIRRPPLGVHTQHLTISMNNGLKFENIASVPLLEMTTEGLFSVSSVSSRGNMVYLSLDIPASGKNGTGIITLYTKDGKSKIVYNITVE